MKSQKLKFSIWILGFVMVFCFGSVCYASFYPVASGTSADTTITTYYSGVQNNDGGYDYLTNSGVLSVLSSNGIDTSAANMISNPLHFGSGISSLPNDNSQTILDNYYKFPLTSNDSGNTGNTWTASLDSPRAWTYVDINGYLYYWSFVANGAGNFAIVNVGTNNYLVSDSVFDIFSYFGVYRFDYLSQANYSNGETAFQNSVNGLYCFDLDQYYDYDYLNFTNLPVYVATHDKSTGFSNIDEFSFSDPNLIDCNYLFSGGSYTDPNAPQLPVPNPYENDKYYLNFADTSYYTGGAVTSFFHQNNFTFNEYVLLNPTNYRIKFEYVAHIKRGGTTYSFSYSPDDIQLAYFLGQSKRFSVGNRLIVPLSSDWFLDSNNHTMSSYLKGTVYDVQGTTSNFSNPNDVLQSDNEIVLDPIFIFRTDEYIEKQLPKLKSAYSFEQFTIDGYVTLYTANDSNYESYVYHDFYDWISGTSSLIDSPNTVPPYSAETPNDTNLPVNQSSGNSNNYASGSVNPTINVNVNAGTNNVPWTPYTLDQISYANVREMFADIKDFVDSTSSNSFWAVLQRVFGYIPQQIWNYIIISVAVICGFSVVRYVLRR